ncbi:MAG: hypothetical protein ACLP4V_21720 [Methylocella sp.]
MRPGARVIHDIPAVSVFFFCSSSGMRLGQAVLAGENHLPPDQALPQADPATESAFILMNYTYYFKIMEVYIWISIMK